MADATAVQTALKAYRNDTGVDAANAKAAEAAARVALETAIETRIRAEADALLARGMNDVMTGAAAVERAVTKAEADPATKWYIGGGLLVLIVAGVWVAYAFLHH